MRPRDARFWWNVALVAVAHLVVLLALARGSRDATPPNLQTVVWMNSDVSAAAAEPRSIPASSPTPAEIEKPEPAPAHSAAAKSEIQMPSPTPTPTTAPKASVTPPPKSSPPKPTPKPTPKATPKKSAEPKPTPKPSEKKEEKKPPTEKKDSSTSANQGSAKTDKSDKGSGTSTTQPSEFAWYGTMLHDRFHKAWEQPKSIVATGAKMSTIVKIRIEKDGRVSKFAIVKPSGNVVVDESVAAIAQRVTQVDPLPEGLAKGSYYEVKIDFELNAGK